MEKYYLSALDSFNPDFNFVCTIGVFDGNHLAHKQIFDLLLASSKERGLKCGIFTFLRNLKNDDQLFSLEEDRLDHYESLGIDFCVIFDGSRDFFNISYLDFDLKYLAKASLIIVGDDFRYGKDRLGDIKTLSHNHEVLVVNLLKIGGEKVSSSLIRNYLMNGDINNANKLLYKPFSISGTVIKGNQIGSQMGIKTANINYPRNTVKIKNGVYKSYCYVDGLKFDAISFVGTKPTVNGKELIVESHIFDFLGDLYDKMIKIEFLEFLREETRFNSIEELKAQILIDIKKVGR